MSRPVSRELLSIGAFLVIVVIAFIVYLMPLNLSPWMVPALIIALSGCWLMVLAAMQARSPQKYGRSAFSYMSWGALLIAVGGAWFLYSISWLYALLIVLLVLGGVAIAAALARK
jgi:hypothetical protein